MAEVYVAVGAHLETENRIEYWLERLTDGGYVTLGTDGWKLSAEGIYAFVVLETLVKLAADADPLTPEARALLREIPHAIAGSDVDEP